ncbi:MAG: cytochrome c maturation protein CcmE [Nitrospinae bacterium]|nr:cytochrome c maturation protein CcmE [Nitrospinota bacterium]
MNKKQIKFIAGSIIIVAAIGYLVVTGISKTSVYYLTVSELLSKGDSVFGQGIRVEGKVMDGSIKKAPSALKVDFKITDSSKDISVHYEGVIPDLFEDGRDVVVEGKYSREGVFMAHTLLTSCPSKYESKGKSHPQEAKKI